MSLIALEFEENQIVAATARVSGRRVQIQHLFSFDISGSDEEVAEQLKVQLASHRLSRADAMVVVSRGNAEVRLVDVPPAPSSELPDIVRFVARNEFASLNDNWMLDYVRLSGDEASTGQVLAAGVSPELSRQMKTILELSGLRLKHIVLRPYAAVDFIQDRLDENRVQLLVDFNGLQTDLTIVDGHKLVATRTIRLSAKEDAAERIIPEVRRTIASSARALSGKSVNQILVCGAQPEHQEMAERLQGRLESDVHLVDPLKQANVGSKIDCENPSRYVALMGALMQRGRQRVPAIDFLNPKKAVSQTGDYRKYWLYGSLAAVALFLLVGFGWWTLRSQTLENEQLKQTLADLKNLNQGKTARPAVDKTLKEVGMVDNWKLNQVNWQEHLLQYSELALTADDTILDSFTGTGPSKKTEGKINVNARSINLPTESALISSLSQNYGVNPDRTSDAKDDDDYPVNSRLYLSLTPQVSDVAAIDKLAETLMKQQVASRQEEAKRKQLEDVSEESSEQIGKTSEDEKAGTDQGKGQEKTSGED